MGTTALGTTDLPSGSSYQPFSFLVAFSVSASWSWARVYCKRVKVSSSIFESTNVLTSPPPAAPNSLAACFAALSASRFPHAWGGGCLLFGDPDNASMQPFQVPIQQIIDSRFFPCFQCPFHWPSEDLSLYIKPHVHAKW